MNWRNYAPMLAASLVLTVVLSPAALAKKPAKRKRHVPPSIPSSPSPVPAPVAPVMGTYAVQAGDKLWQIADRFGTSIDAIQTANNLTSIDWLDVGQILIIPSGTSTPPPAPTAPPAPAPSPAPPAAPTAPAAGAYTVQPGDTLYLIAQKLGTTIEALQRANGLVNPDMLYAGQVLARPSASQTTAPATTSGKTLEAGVNLEAAVWGSRYIVSREGFELLARLVTAEAGGEPYAGQVAVAATVLNRMEDPRFPSALEGVIYQGLGTPYPQYSPAANGTISGPAVPSAYQAVMDALNGQDPSRGANGFYNPDKTSNPWVRAQPTTVTIGGHVFFTS